MKTNTIAAVATAMADSGIGIIRISGEEAFQIVDRVFRPGKGNKKVSEMETHTLHHGYIVDGDATIDEVLILVMRAPGTYTGEDVVEIDGHGGVLVMRRLLEVFLKHGARPAEPGEFTKRAFLNGRIDLTQAESVADIISAKSELALKNSLSQLAGTVRDRIRNIRADILHEMAFVESALDDPEHYSLDGYRNKLTESVQSAAGKVHKLLLSADNGKIMREGIRTVIVGKPNAGKSSWLNLLAGEEKAIVTEIAGTTRDAVEEQIQIGGIGLCVIDTAGIRKAEDVVEKIGVSKSREYLARADLAIYVVDSSTKLDENDEDIIAAIRDKKAIVLLNKSDLEVQTTQEEIKRYLDKQVISVSAKQRQGVRELEKMIRGMFFDGKLTFDDEVYITSARQKFALEETEHSLKRVLSGIGNEMPEDVLMVDMMDAYRELGTVIGESVEEDLIDEIFSKFCMGK